MNPSKKFFVGFLKSRHTSATDIAEAVAGTKLLHKKRFVGFVRSVHTAATAFIAPTVYEEIKVVLPPSEMLVSLPTSEVSVKLQQTEFSVTLVGDL